MGLRNSSRSSMPGELVVSPDLDHPMVCFLIFPTGGKQMVSKPCFSVLHSMGKSRIEGFEGSQAQPAPFLAEQR